MARPLSRRKLSAYVAERLVGNEASAVIDELAGYLVETGRTNELDLIIRDINLELQQRGIVNAVVTSARPLSEDTKADIEAFIIDSTGAKRVITIETVDPTVIGGVRINLPDRQLDRTIARRINKLKTNYQQA